MKIDTQKVQTLVIYSLISMVVLLKTIGPILFIISQFLPAGDPLIISLFGDNILICTPNGIKYISADEL